jgi:hypothetical protein
MRMPQQSEKNRRGTEYAWFDKLTTSGNSVQPLILSSVEGRVLRASVENYWCKPR